MTGKKPKAPPRKDNPAGRQVRRKPKDKSADRPPDPVAVDRPGFDLGGSTGKTSAGSGVGLGQDAAENRRDRRLPGRRGKSK
jgi:hypothetical protein